MGDRAKTKGRRTYGVIGLGNFGSTVATELQRFGNHVIGIDITEAREVLRDLVVERRRRVTIDHIAQAVTGHFEVKLAELQSKKRTQAVAVPRQICMFLARRLTGHSLEEIGGFFGGRDHSTVLYGVDRITARSKDDVTLRDTVEQLATQALSVAGS